MLPEVLGVIPARGGSKSIPRKNIARLHGKPILAYTIEAALGCRSLTRVIVSSEDAEILEVARQYGAATPFIRPAELATDEAPTLPVVQHAVAEMERLGGLTFDYIVLLQPTTPLRRSQDIDAAVDKLIATAADSVVSVCEVGAYHPARMRQIVDDRLVDLPVREPQEMLRRQDLPPVYIRNGAIYAVKRDVVMLENSMIGRVSRPYIMPEERSVNIDSRLDFLLAEILLRPAEQPQD
ncbi:MAG TPA: acylneuraminate cytidylyltransferase family protein [Anaerolineales bacterium]|nr:acylneuraminate cytidylyltransferase family protein [Anaerolineales bacterium]